MIETIYKNKYMVICDNCEEGTELDTWDECMEYMRDNDWKRKLIDGEFNNYCPECGQKIDWNKEEPDGTNY